MIFNLLGVVTTGSKTLSLGRYAGQALYTVSDTAQRAASCCSFKLLPRLSSSINVQQTECSSTVTAKLCDTIRAHFFLMLEEPS